MATEGSVAGESGDQDFVNIDNVDAFPTKDGSSSPAPQEPGIILSVGQQGGSRRKQYDVTPAPFKENYFFF